MDKTICELFAGVGGFRLGFERLNSGWKTVWFSQWEPGIKTQWAHDCYVQHFGDCIDLKGNLCTNDDISLVDKNNIPDHSLLVGGFPCQDYSVAQTLSTSKGIEGKKGILWWQIRDTLIAKRPPFCLLENVDRLILSPASQRGRDFGIILACFNELGYSVEWRVVNASRYGAVQKRTRTFIFAYRNDTVYGKRIGTLSPKEVVGKDGFMVKAFPISEIRLFTHTTLDNDIVTVSDEFSFYFGNAGYMQNGEIHTTKVVELKESSRMLGSILQHHVDDKYYISEDKMPKWIYLKGQKKIPRVSKTGFEYVFSERAMSFPDPWNKPGRTMLTSEGTLNRSSHVVKDPGTLDLRTLTPIEAERLQDFDDDWTNTGMSDRMRYFCMGNALVVSMVTRMARVLDGIFEEEVS